MSMITKTVTEKLTRKYWFGIYDSPKAGDVVKAHTAENFEVAWMLNMKASFVPSGYSAYYTALYKSKVHISSNTSAVYVVAEYTSDEDGTGKTVYFYLVSENPFTAELSIHRQKERRSYTVEYEDITKTVNGVKRPTVLHEWPLQDEYYSTGLVYNAMIDIDIAKVTQYDKLMSRELTAPTASEYETWGNLVGHGAGVLTANTELQLACVASDSEQGTAYWDGSLYSDLCAVVPDTEGFLARAKYAYAMKDGELVRFWARTTYGYTP